MMRGLHGVGSKRSWFLWCAVMSVFFGVGLSARTCSVLLGSNKGLTACQALPKLGSTLAWTIHTATNSVDFAFSGSATSSGGWVGWGINPTAQAMVGTQTLIAFQSSAGAVVRTYDITGAMKSGSAAFVPGNLTLNFTKLASEISGTEMTIFATLNMKPNALWTMNHVWNQGSSVDLATNAVGPHAFAGASLESVASINLATNVAFSDVQSPHQKLKNRHGILSAVGWGILLPLGIMAARYLRPFSGSNPAWFYIHVSCQCTGYTLGVIAWAMGLQLHTYIVNESAAVPSKHRNIGITIFTFATLQVLALWLRPKPDAKYRSHWNVYHHLLGYSTLVLIIVNIFQGLDLLQPGTKWTNAYIVVLTVLGGTSFFMEIVVWSVWLRQRAQKNAARTPPSFPAGRQNGHSSRSRDSSMAAAGLNINAYGRNGQAEMKPMDVV